MFYSNRAACYIALGKFQQGYLDSKKALEVNPDFVKAVRRLIACTIKLGHLDETKEILNQYMVSHPKEKGLQEDLRTLADVTNLQKAVEGAVAKENF